LRSVLWVFLFGACCFAPGEKEPQAVPLKGRIERFPVVTTGKRWASMDEIRGTLGRYFEQYPQVKADTQRSQFDDAVFPAPFSRGGGLFPVLLLTDSGELVCILRTGAPHVGSGAELSITFSSDRGRTWTPYTVVARGDIDSHLDPRNPSIGQAANGDLVLVYSLYGDYDERYKPVPRGGFIRMEVRRSKNGGRNWSKPAKLESPPGFRLAPYGQMRRLKDGTLVFNARGSPDSAPQRQVSYLYWSRDRGASWDKPTLLRDGKTETAFLALDQLHWVAYVRDNDGPAMIAHSYDGGETWPQWDRMLGAARQVRGRIPGSITRLPDGLVLITYGYREYPFGLRAVVSRDGGSSFDLSREYVLSDSYFHHDSGYPSTVAFADGTIVTVAYANKDLEHPEWGTACIAYRYHQKLFE